MSLLRIVNKYCVCVHVLYVLVFCRLYFQGYSPVIGTPRAENQEAHRLAARSSPCHNSTTEVILYSSSEYFYVTQTQVFFKHMFSSLPRGTYVTTMGRREGFPFQLPGLQTASTPLRTVFNSRSRKMKIKKGGANHKDTFPHCR